MAGGRPGPARRSRTRPPRRLLNPRKAEAINHIGHHVLPAALAWILWDDWYWRPMFLTWLILAPAKFGPPFNWWWLWPGLL